MSPNQAKTENSRRPRMTPSAYGAKVLMYAGLPFLAGFAYHIGHPDPAQAGPAAPGMPTPQAEAPTAPTAEQTRSVIDDQMFRVANRIISHIANKADLYTEPDANRCGTLLNATYDVTTHQIVVSGGIANTADNENANLTTVFEANGTSAIARKALDSLVSVGDIAEAMATAAKGEGGVIPQAIAVTAATTNQKTHGIYLNGPDVYNTKAALSYAFAGPPNAIESVTSPDSLNVLSQNLMAETNSVLRQLTSDDCT